MTAHKPFDLSDLKKKFSKKTLNLLKEIAKEDINIYLVGGCVRDYLLLGEIGKDLDFEYYLPSNLSFDQLVENLSKKYKVRPLNHFKSFKLTLDECELEFTHGRREDFSSHQEASYKAFHHEYLLHSQLALSFLRRDFTINSMLVNVSQESWELIDFTNGESDLRSRNLKPVNLKTFPKDPVRFLRSFRFAINLDFKFHYLLIEVLQKADLTKLTSDQFQKELFKAKDHSRFLKEVLDFISKHQIKVPTFLSSLENYRKRENDLLNFNGDDADLVCALVTFEKQEYYAFCEFYPWLKTQRKLFDSYSSLKEMDLSSLTKRIKEVKDPGELISLHNSIDLSESVDFRSLKNILQQKPHLKIKLISSNNSLKRLNEIFEITLNPVVIEALGKYGDCPQNRTEQLRFLVKMALLEGKKFLNNI